MELGLRLPDGSAPSGMHDADVSAALAEGLTTRPLRETLADTWAWLQAEGDPAPRADAPSPDTWLDRRRRTAPARPALTLRKNHHLIMRAIIIGAGIAGLAAALRLRQIGWDTLIVERAPARRGGGYAVTFGGIGYDAAERMGILPALQAGPSSPTNSSTTSPTAHAASPSTATPSPPPSAAARSTSCAATSKPSCTRRSATTPRSASAPPSPPSTRTSDAVHVTLSDGTRRTRRPADRRRRPALGHPRPGLRPGGGLPARPGPQGRRLHARQAPRRHRRPAPPAPCHPAAAPSRSSASATAATSPSSATEPTAARATRPTTRTRSCPGSTATSAGSSPKSSPACRTAESVYFDTISQIVIDRWSHGRVVLLGDAAWCVTLFAGYGSALAVGGADLLGTTLADNPGDIPAALTRGRPNSARRPNESRSSAAGSKASTPPPTPSPCG